MISAEDFIAQNTPRSALEPFHREIAKLRAAKMSYQKIQAFLKLNGIETHVNNVRGYCQRHIETQNTTKTSPKTRQLTKKKTPTTEKISKATKTTKVAKKTTSAKIANKKHINKDGSVQKIGKKKSLVKKAPKVVQEPMDDRQIDLF